MSGTQRLNFASYLAKLASTLVYEDRMCQVTLVIFRCAFEQRQEILPSEGNDEGDSHRSMGLLELRHLLPAAHAWFNEASYNLMQLSEVSWNDCPSAIGQGGLFPRLGVWEAITHYIHTVEMDVLAQATTGN